MRFLHELLPAVLADKLLLAEVSSHVVLIDRVGAEPLLTVTTLVLLLPSVKGHVLLQVGFLGESLPTESTEPGFGKKGVLADFVISQCRGGEVGLVAFIALVAPGPRVVSHVKVQAVLTLQSLPTDGADEIFLRGVLYLVLLQLVPVPAPLTTDVTLHYLGAVAPRHNPVVHSLVSQQVLIDLESLPTALHITGKALQLLVDHLVYPESGAGGEMFLTNITDIRPLARVKSLVVGELGLECESLITAPALEWFLSCVMTADVDVQRGFPLEYLATVLNYGILASFTTENLVTSILH